MNRKALIDFMENTSSHILIEGAAGTGKTHLIREFLGRTKKFVLKVAPTGLAASHFDGYTIHSAFNYESSIVLPGEIDSLEELKHIDTVLIDEISMCSCNLIDSIEKSLQISRKNNLPFGGVQLIMVGDPFQLGPVIDTDFKNTINVLNPLYEAPYYFFNGLSLKKIISTKSLITFSLRRNYRHEQDPVFGFILERIRHGISTEVDLVKINGLINGMKGNETILATKNIDVSSFNARFLDFLDTKIYFSVSDITPLTEMGYLETHETHIDIIQSFSEGASVIFTQNNPAYGYVNGTQGKIVQIIESEDDSSKIESIIVNITSGPSRGKKVNVKRTIRDIKKPYWNKQNNLFETHTKVSIVQFPLKLAFALTIHKSQGLTIENVIIDIGTGAFASGQVYTALSRPRSLQNLFVYEDIKDSDIKVEPAVVNFMKQMTWIPIDDLTAADN